MDISGSMIEFLQDGKLKFAYVDRCSGKRLLVTDENGREQRIPRRDMIVNYGTIRFEDLQQEISTQRELIQDYLTEIDTEFLHDFRVAVRRTRSV